MRYRLTDVQVRAAVSRAPRTFIEAGPGTGKTTIAAERFGCARYRQPIASQRGVVAVSFTVAATQELRQRIIDRWGPTALASPSRVNTIDRELTDILCFLLRSKLIKWPGDLNLIEPLDSCEQHPAWTYDKNARHQTWQPELVDGEVQPVSVPVDGRRITKTAMIDLLEAGICTHDDVRRILGAALQDAELRAALIEYRQETVAHFIVDEVFDADSIDLELIRLHCEAGIPTTVAGDHWQALYEFRQAVPSDVSDLVSVEDGPQGFHRVPITKSYRYGNEALAELAANLREGGCTLATDDGTSLVEVVIGRWWKHLWEGPTWVLPLSFGRVSNQTDALLALLVDHVAHQAFGVRGRSEADALMRLKATEEDLAAWRDELACVKAMLTDTSDEVSNDALEALRRCRSNTGTGATVPRLNDAGKEHAATGSMRALAARLLVGQKLVPGVTAHQAKGQQWRSVGVCIPDDDVVAIEAGLDINNPQHRALYVALTRGTHLTVRVLP